MQNAIPAMLLTSVSCIDKLHILIEIKGNNMIKSHPSKLKNTVVKYILHTCQLTLFLSPVIFINKTYRIEYTIQYRKFY